MSLLSPRFYNWVTKGVSEGHSVVGLRSTYKLTVYWTYLEVNVGRINLNVSNGLAKRFV